MSFGCHGVAELPAKNAFLIIVVRHADNQRIGGAEMEPSGFLPFKTTPVNGDKLVLYPVYICPVEILERGVMIRPSYSRKTVIVNAFNRRTKLLDEGLAEVSADFDISAFEARRLDVKVSPRLAAELAEYGAVTDDFRSWRRMVRSRRVEVDADKIRLAWHVYAVAGGVVTDTFSGETAPAAALADAFFS